MNRQRVAALLREIADELEAPDEERPRARRRRPGTGTIEPRGHRAGAAAYMARLPDKKRTPLGVFPTRAESSRVLDAAVDALRSESLLFGHIMCFSPVDWPDHGGVYACTTGSRWPSVKIGRSASLSRRLAELERELREPVGLLAVLSDDPEDEPVLHQRFHRLHVQGEWFRFTNALEREINARRR